MEEMVKKPWGSYQNILDEDYTKVKKIVINPGESPSYQYHFKRSEIWVLVKGTGKVKIDDEVHYYREGDVVFIPKEAKHQMTNIGDADLIFIEVQLGESFEEEDIVRLEDKYGRL
ncbi:MAG: cupin domain-containing protein [Proteobacteria bacterium]|nr:cupin domain-containing protein [Pseudomonadota bacterium]